MFTRSLRTRAFPIASVFALCTFAMSAQADPMTLQGVCHVTSIVAGQGSCQLTYLLSDDFPTRPAFEVTDQGRRRRRGSSRE
jgi:hypothetical protein